MWDSHAWQGSAPSAAHMRLACRRTTILPAMHVAEAVETTRIHSVTARTGARMALVTTSPPSVSIDA